MPFLIAWWKACVGVIAGILLAFPIAMAVGAHHEAKLEAAQRETAIAAALGTNEIAIEQSADQRLTDAQTVAETQKALNDAVAALPAKKPSLRDVARACQQLRNQG